MVSVGESMANCYKSEELEVIKRTEEILRSHGEVETADALKKIRYTATEISGSMTSSPRTTTSTNRSTLELKIDVEKALSKYFKKDCGLYKITNDIWAKVLYDTNGVSIIMHHNEFTLGRINMDDKTQTRIRIDGNGHIVRAEVLGTYAYRPEFQNAIDKVLSILR